MSRSICVHLLRTLVNPDDLRGGIAVVIDVLRASSTMIYALASGAKKIVPCSEIEQAKTVAEGLPARDVLLGGERGGKIIEGFNLGNSPVSYWTDVVNQKTVVFTTTNGTRTLQQCRQADAVFIGTFLNRAAIVDVLLNDHRPIHLVCAGTDGLISTEDCLFAGMIVSNLVDHNGDAEWNITDDSTQLAMSFHEQSCGLDDRSSNMHELHLGRETDEKRFEAMQKSRGGRNLIRLGMEGDIRYCSQTDEFAIVPKWNPESNEVRIARSPS